MMDLKDYLHVKVRYVRLMNVEYFLGVLTGENRGIRRNCCPDNPLTPELNPSKQPCPLGFFTGHFKF